MTRAVAAPVQDALVAICNEPHGCAYASTDARGAFSLSVNPGTYYLFTQNGGDLVDEVYDNIQCAGSCSEERARAALVSVTSGNETSGIRFDLDTGGIITGTVRRSGVTSAPLSGIVVALYQRSPAGDAVLERTTSTDTSGVYTFEGLRHGTYYAHTWTESEYINDIPCADACSSNEIISNALAIEITADTARFERNFALQPGGRISGQVLAWNGAPIAGAHVQVYAGSMLAGTATTNESGDYSVAGLPTGIYHAFTDGAPGYVNEIFGGVSCFGHCSADVAAAAGLPISVTAGADAAGVLFRLTQGGAIAGTVRNAVTSLPMADESVYVYRDLGGGDLREVGHGSTNSDGAYSISGLLPGEYFVVSAAAGVQNQVYSGTACPRVCPPTVIATGTPVTVLAGATASNRDFALSAATAAISGIVRNAASAAAVEGVFVRLYRRFGAGLVYVGGGRSDEAGAYTIANLPPGSYYAVSSSYGAFVDEIYPDIPCLTTCDFGVGAALLGAPIVATTGTINVDFALQPLAAQPPGQARELAGRIAAGTVTLEWEEPYEGGAATDYLLEVGLLPGQALLSLPVAGTAYSQGGVPPGRYFVRVRARNANGVGPASSEYAFTINADGSGAPDPPTSLSIVNLGDRIQASWTPASSGGEATGYLLEVGTRTGASNIARVPLGQRALFSYNALPPAGVYFARVRAHNQTSISDPSDEVLLVVGGASSPPSAPGEIGAVLETSGRLTVAWLPPPTAVSGFVLEVGTAEGRSDLGVLRLPPAPNVFTVPGLPPGVYYFRLRSINAAGVGLPSYDTTLIVR